MNYDRPSPAEPPGNARAGPEAVPIHRILVVDDDSSLRQLIVRTLMNAGHHVDAAEDGEDAWNVLQLQSYDLLVTDQEMPRVTGVDLVKKLRAAQMALPVILVSGRMPTEELNCLPWLHFAATLAKPFTDAELVTTVDDALRWTDDGGTLVPPSPPSNE
jgi:DNA-binding response OmpR family regulator